MRTSVSLLEERGGWTGASPILWVWDHTLEPRQMQTGPGSGLYTVRTGWVGLGLVGRGRGLVGRGRGLGLGLGMALVESNLRSTCAKKARGFQELEEVETDGDREGCVCVREREREKGVAKTRRKTLGPGTRPDNFEQFHRPTPIHHKNRARLTCSVERSLPLADSDRAATARISRTSVVKAKRMVKGYRWTVVVDCKTNPASPSFRRGESF